MEKLALKSVLAAIAVVMMSCTNNSKRTKQEHKATIYGQN